MKSSERRESAETGFGLVETLIAAAIIAGMSALFFESIAVDAQLAQAMTDRRDAALVAQSVLDATVGSGAATPRSGIEGEIRWNVATAPLSRADALAPPLDLITVTIARSGSDRTVLRVRTLRLGA